MKTNPASFYLIKDEINELSLDPAAKLGLRLAFLAIGLQFIILALSWYRLPPQAPLFYSRAYGETQLAASFWLWLLPITSFLVELVSIRLAAKVKAEETLWSQIFSWTGTMVALMSLITLLRIILLVI